MPTTVTNVAVSATSDGANTVIAAVSGHIISVLGYCVTTIGTGGFIWKSNTTALSGTITPIAGTPVVAPMTEDDAKPWFSCAVGEALICTTAAGVDVTGHLKYRVEKP